MNELSVGIALTTEPDRTRDRLDRLCASLSALLDMPVLAHGLWHYGQLYRQLEEGELDLVWLPPLPALRATGQGTVVPIALPVRHGVSTYSAALFTRAGSAIRTIDDLRGVSAAWVDRQSASGYLVIRALLRSANVDLDEAFGEESFLGNHNAVAQAVLDGKADVGATFVYLDPDSSSGAAFPNSAGWGDGDVHVISCAGSIPSDIFAVNKTMPKAVREAIQNALVDEQYPELQGAAQALVGAESFVAPSKEHLESLIEILQDLEDDSGVISVLPDPG